MNNYSEIQERLAVIQQQEGESFVVDDIAMQEEYQEQFKERPGLAIKILSFIGGYLASLAFLATIVLSGFYESIMGITVLGGVCIAVSILFNSRSKTALIDSTSISIYLIGIAMFSYGLDQSQIDINVIRVIIILIALSTISIVRNYIMIFLSVLILTGCILNAIVFENFAELIHLFISLLAVVLTYWIVGEAKIITSHRKLSEVYNPVRIGLLLSFIISLVFIGKSDMLPIENVPIWLSSISTIGCTLFVLSRLSNILNVQQGKDTFMMYAFTLVVLLPTANSPSISGSILILLLSFMVRFIPGIVLGLIALVYFIGQYYYDLNTTLLVKSILLFASGFFFIMLYLFITYKMKSDEKI